MNLSKRISEFAWRVSPRLGRLYDCNRKFWNDGFVGFIIGVPITYVLFLPIVGFINLGNPVITEIIRFLFYILCAFISFCVQHVLRKKWVFRGGDESIK